MTGPPRDRCTRYQPDVMCETRRLEMALDRFWMHPSLLQWVYPQRRGSPGPYGLWQFCPFCQGALPSVSDAVRRALDTDDEDGDDGD